jgi:hypothetical protein
VLQRDEWTAELRDAQRTGALQTLVVFLAPVPFLLVAHQLYFWDVGPFASPRWAVNGDRSVIEILGYVQLLAAVVLLCSLGVVRRRGLVYVGCAATLLVIVLDDSLGWHERGGAWLNRRQLVPGLFGLPEQALGELVTWGLLGIPVLLLLWGTHRVGPARARHDSWWLAGLTGLLIVFGVGVDIVHEAIEELTDNSVVDLLVTLVEAGGEVGAMTVLLAYVVHITRRPALPEEVVPLDTPSSPRPLA